MRNLGKNSVFINENGIIEILVNGDQTADSVQAMGDAIAHYCTLQQKKRKPVLLLDDVSHIGKVPPEARKRVVELAKNLHYDKLVMYGQSTILRLGGNLLLQASGRGDSVRYFEDYDEATAWLKS